MIRGFFKFLFSIIGWKVEGELPEKQRFILIVAPHTSNWDFFVGVAARSILRLKSNYLGKKSLFDFPVFGRIFTWLGGHPVDRSKSTNIVDQVVELFEAHDEFVLTITPEGTRSYQPNWKTGFYRIAHKANVPILIVAFDYGNKAVVLKELFRPTGDMDKDIEYIKSYYRTIKGKRPELGVK